MLRFFCFLIYYTELTVSIMKNSPPVIPFLFFVAVIIVLSGSMLYFGIYQNKNQSNSTQAEILVKQNTRSSMIITSANVILDPDAAKAFTLVSEYFTLKKMIQTPNGDYWFEVGPADSDVIDLRAKSSLWHVSGKESEYGLVEKKYEGQSGYCAEFNWELEGEDIVLRHMESPCEAGASYKTHIFSQDGSTKMQLSYSLPGNSITIFDNGMTNISTEMDACQEDQLKDGKPLPKIKLHGLRINDTIIPLEQSVTLSCIHYYDEYLMAPSIENVDFAYKENKLSFTLPNGQTASILLNNLYAENRKINTSAITIK